MTPKAVLAVLCAAIIWGISPIFYKMLSHVPALEVLSHRMIWSLVFFGAVLGFQNRLMEIPAAFENRRTSLLIVLASAVIAINWALFIWSVQAGLTTQSSLGYYIYPLFSVVLGWIFFSEKLAPVQWVAVGIVTVAVGLLTVGVGTLPWVALVLAGSFALYGVLKKQLALGPVISVTIEVLLVVPVAVLLLFQAHFAGHSVFGGDWKTFVLLVLAGPMTAVPLILFGYGARRLKMASVGLMLYLNPTLQFASAVFLFSEPFSLWHLVAFCLIWLALGLYSSAAWKSEKARRSALRQAAASETTS